MNHHEQLRQISEHVHRYYDEHPNDKLFYHNLGHTKEMVEACRKIAEHYKLNDHDYFVVTAAAWFHDTGYLTNYSTFHEVKSASLAEKFLESIGTDVADILEIKNCILATKMPQSPNTELEKIVCDADLYHLGTERFRENSKHLRREVEALTGKELEGSQWRANNIRLLESHQYHTDYCRQLLSKGKAENLERLKRKQEEKAGAAPKPLMQRHNGRRKATVSVTEDGKLENDPEKAAPVQIAEAHRDKDPHRQGKPTRSEKSIELMFRIASANHQRLSSMADNKAHIMISVNSIIITVVISLVLKKLDENRFLIVPTIILLLINLVAIIYSVLATRPQIPNGHFDKEQVYKKSVNLLFFGNFYRMSYSDYDWGIKRVMDDREFLYESLINDMYWHGVVLGRKYRYLRTSYSVFMYGISAAIIGFTIAILFL